MLAKFELSVGRFVVAMALLLGGMTSSGYVRGAEDEDESPSKKKYELIFAIEKAMIEAVGEFDGNSATSVQKKLVDDRVEASVSKLLDTKPLLLPLQARDVVATKNGNYDVEFDQYFEVPDSSCRWMFKPKENFKSNNKSEFVITQKLSKEGAVSVKTDKSTDFVSKATAFKKQDKKAVYFVVVVSRNNFEYKFIATELQLVN